MRNAAHVFGGLAVVAMSLGCTSETSELTSEQQQDLSYPTLDGSGELSVGHNDGVVARIPLQDTDEDILYYLAAGQSFTVNTDLQCQASISFQRNYLGSNNAESYVVNIAYIATLHCESGDQSRSDFVRLAPYNETVPFWCDDSSRLYGVDITFSQAHYNDWIVDP